MRKFIKRLIFTQVALFIYLQVSVGQEVPYGTGNWDPEGLGNHRAVIYVEKYSDAVMVSIPWRRLDDVENKDLILIDALTNQRIKNIYCLQKKKDFGEIVFQPVSGEGKYYLYYMPGRNGGNQWFPEVMYSKPTDIYDKIWKNRSDDHINKQIGSVIAFESVSDYHSFYPMEVPVTQLELTGLLVFL